MTRTRILQVAGGVAVGVALSWVTMRGLERMIRPRHAAAPPAADQASPATAHITATLFYVSEDGQSLVPVRREVPLAEGVVAQGREIMAVQLEPAPSPYRSAVPSGTMLRALYVTPRGDAFVDLSAAISQEHPGGSTAELLTVYTVVDAITVNLPAIQRVQILVDGKSVDTIAGHVDVRRPLQKNDTVIQNSK